jgi:carbonic anhydrase/acetyltransferase-like protein (isoleucine patch superfamily)
VWYDAVIRGDFSTVKIGKNTNIQDRAVITTAHGGEEPQHSSVSIGEGVTVGHGATIISATIHNNIIIGQGSVVLEGAEIGSNSIVAAGAVIRPHTHVGEGEMWAGNPAVLVRRCKENEVNGMRQVIIYESTA